MKKYLIFTAIAVAIAIIAIALVAGAKSSVYAQDYTFSNNLTVGSSGQDVVNLQTWLISNGYDIPAISSGSAAKGYFGSQTKAALIRYQTSVSLPAFGFFGPLTRQILNGGGNNDNNPTDFLRVISPNGGETWQTGTTQYITWTGTPGALNQTGDIRLEFPVPACAEPGQPIRCMIAVRAPLTIASGVNLGSDSYAWNVGNSVPLAIPCDAFATSCPDQMTPIASGQYKIQICLTNGSQCDDSDNYFTITTNGVTNGQTPVISGIDAPTSLSVNQTGTWTIHASDPANGVLSYSVNWGDSPNCNYPATCATPAMAMAFIQSTSFTHVYSNPGTYMITFTVRDNAGLQAQTTSTVNVTGSTAVSPLRIISPNGGEAWARGTTQNIVWTSPYYFAATTADLKLVPYQAPCPAGSMCPMYMLAPYTIATGIAINQDSYSWDVGQYSNINGNGGTGDVGTVPDGQYSVQICQSGTSNCDSSDGVFNIVQ